MKIINHLYSIFYKFTEDRSHHILCSMFSLNLSNWVLNILYQNHLVDQADQYNFDHMFLPIHTLFNQSFVVHSVNHLIFEFSTLLLVVLIEPLLYLAIHYQKYYLFDYMKRVELLVIMHDILLFDWLYFQNQEMNPVDAYKIGYRQALAIMLVYWLKYKQENQLHNFSYYRFYSQLGTFYWVKFSLFHYYQHYFGMFCFKYMKHLLLGFRHIQYLVHYSQHINFQIKLLEVFVDMQFNFLFYILHSLIKFVSYANFQFFQVLHYDPLLSFIIQVLTFYLLIVTNLFSYEADALLMQDLLSFVLIINFTREFLLSHRYVFQFLHFFKYLIIATYREIGNVRQYLNILELFSFSCVVNDYLLLYSIIHNHQFHGYLLLVIFFLVFSLNPCSNQVLKLSVMYESLSFYSKK